MSIRTQAFLNCDGPDCSNAFPHSVVAQFGYEIRAEAELRGWQRRVNQDYCPECAAKLPPVVEKTTPKGECSVCGKTVRLNLDGETHNHDLPRGSTTRMRRCPGSHRKPKVVQP